MNDSSFEYPERTPVLHQEVLDSFQCGDPTCQADCMDPLAIRPNCHFEEGVNEVIYHKERGQIQIRCAICHEPVCLLPIASMMDDGQSEDTGESEETSESPG